MDLFDAPPSLGARREGEFNKLMDQQMEEMKAGMILPPRNQPARAIGPRTINECV